LELAIGERRRGGTVFQTEDMEGGHGELLMPGMWINTGIKSYLFDA
jgi:hypothetical protein